MIRDLVKLLTDTFCIVFLTQNHLWKHCKFIPGTLRFWRKFNWLWKNGCVGHVMDLIAFGNFITFLYILNLVKVRNNPIFEIFFFFWFYLISKSLIMTKVSMVWESLNFGVVFLVTVKSQGASIFYSILCWKRPSVKISINLIHSLW